MVKRVNTKGIYIVINISSVSVGPHQQPDMESETWCMVVVVFVNGVIDYGYELYSSSFDWLYGIQSYCLSGLGPYVLDEGRT